MRIIFFAVILRLFVGISSAHPSDLVLEDGLFNDTSSPWLSSRSLEKREVFDHCDDPKFSGLLDQVLKDAVDIMSNMVEHLNLAISLYDEDGSGNLKQSKAERSQRTFDEQNAWASYNIMISRIYARNAAPNENKEGLDKLKGTRDLAETIKSQYEAYREGRSVRWTRGGFPYINIFCSDTELYSATNSAGLTYSEDVGGPNAFLGPNGKPLYWLSQRIGGPPGKEVWVFRRDVCALKEGKGQTRFGNVPADPGVTAYTTKAKLGLIAETMVFCPVKLNGWMDTETARTRSGLHYRNMHVPIGSSPTDDQKAAAKQLMALDDFTNKNRATRWLSDFLVQTLLHESTHAQAFTGVGKDLIDVHCTQSRENLRMIATSVDPGCMAAIASGDNGRAIDESGTANGPTQGHKNAESFAIYAMAMWYNSVYWFRGLMPRDRNTYSG